MSKLDNEIKYLKGVGDFRAKLLNKLGIYCIGDLLEYFPRGYINRKSSHKISELEIGKHCAVVGKISAIDKRVLSRGKNQLNVYISDGEDYLLCTWFRNFKYLENIISEGKNLWVSGIVKEFYGELQLVHPEIEVLDETSDTEDFWHNRSVLPIYPLTDKITMKQMRTMIYNAFAKYHDAIEETLPDYILEKYNFAPRKIALQKIHFSINPDDVPKYKFRFAFEELFYTQLMLARVKKKHQQTKSGFQFQLKRTYTTRLKESLPFQMTKAQKRVIKEIVQDMNSTGQMNRLLQGDVGSGKTIVTLFALLLAVENGFQAALMAPTELLAEQHFLGIKSFLSNQPELKIALLKGGVYKGKKAVKEQIKSGEIDIVIGTHALIQKDIEFAKLGIVAIDEQHRFGVEQRARLAGNSHPDLLYLSATPIPRSLAMTVYGDLDVSVIDELPPGRKPIQTIWKSSKKKPEIYAAIQRQLEAGRQVYIVCPLIEESEKIDLLDAETLYKKISTEIFPQFKSELLHGKMKTAEKDKIMQRFKDGDTKILVSTTVIEVGIDVPNATVMMIEHAERFGLSQLHQLRGRVGRGSEKSYCYLIGYQPISSEGRERLSTMQATNDGFAIAEKDLEIRGPGDFFGTAQSGMPNFKHANIVRDQGLLKQARILAFEIVQKDRDFSLPENKILYKRYAQQYKWREKLFEY